MLEEFFKKNIWPSGKNIQQKDKKNRNKKEGIIKDARVLSEPEKD